MSAATGSVTVPGRAPARGRRGEVVTLVAVCVATTLVMGLVAAINLAVPMFAASALHPGASQLLWIVDAYVLTFACLVIPGGAAGDRFGRKGALVTGLAIFAAGAILTALAPGVPALLVGRIVTGLGAALVLPNAVGVLVHATAPERRGRALGTWGAVSGLGGLSGNIGGGAILAAGHWQALFWVIAPLALACALWIAFGIPRSDRSPRSLDPAGTALLVAASVTLLTGVIEGPERGWGSRVVIGAFLLSALLWAVWVLVELRVRHPLLDPRLFRIPLLAAACVGMFVTFFGSFGLFYLNASLLEYGRGLSVLLTGVAILPLALPLVIGARFVPALARRVGFTPTLATAFTAIGGGLFGLSTATSEPYPVYALWLVLVGCGFALAMPVLTIELASALPAHQAGVAGGLQSATREFGSALGVAVVGTVLTAVFSATLPSAVHGHTVAAALATAPARHAVIVGAFVTGANAALRTAGAVTLAAGLVVVLTARRATRAR
ncbi:MFS transporter [Streptantibioticus parmotrematis]|uniref:MFS transporter n=1 Tax=Streptantibioticus parmotrematis TaxID=2873249 RepID=UPI0033D83907